MPHIRVTMFYQTTGFDSNEISRFHYIPYTTQLVLYSPPPPHLPLSRLPCSLRSKRFRGVFCTVKPISVFLGARGQTAKNAQTETLATLANSSVTGTQVLLFCQLQHILHQPALCVRQLMF